MSTLIGGHEFSQALGRLESMTAGFEPITCDEFQARMNRAQQWLKDNGIAALYLHAGTSLYYFTGLKWSPSERMVAAVLPAEGPLCYIAPQFEIDTLRDYWLLEAEILTWEEHESPFDLVAHRVQGLGSRSREVLVDPISPFFIVAGLQKAFETSGYELASGQEMINAFRGRKSATELRLIKQSHEMTARVIEAAASGLKVGMHTTELIQFINQAHQRVGAIGSSFCIVLFGRATSFPHGVKEPQTLQTDDWVLIDTGCLLHGYHSDITRSFPFGRATSAQQDAWMAEHRAQWAGFHAAQIGAPCENCDTAARDSLVASGYGPDYQLPGLPHRTGHGCGLDIHEAPYLVRGNQEPMAEGMVFSCEPMLVIPGEFGVRLEDHFFMKSSGPEWFTPPASAMDNFF